MSWRPRVLVIGPGGMKALKVLGFMAVMEDKEFFKCTDTYCGVSAGAIISLLMVAGYTVREIIRETNKLNLFGDLENFELKTSINKSGIMSTDTIRKHLTTLILNKFGTIPSLKSLYLQTDKCFVSVALNVTDEKCEIMDPFSHPCVSCIDATMCSINVPFIYYQLLYNSKVYLDGALGNPYPINYFDDGNTNILGIYIKNINVSYPNDTIPPDIFLFKIVDCIINQRRNEIISSSSPKCRHVCLETQHFGIIGSAMTLSDKTRLLVEGFNQAKSFLASLHEDSDQISSDPRPFYRYPPTCFHDII